MPTLVNISLDFTGAILAKVNDILQQINFLAHSYNFGIHKYCRIMNSHLASYICQVAGSGECEGKRFLSIDSRWRNFRWYDQVLYLDAQTSMQFFHIHYCYLVSSSLSVAVPT